MMSEKIDTGVTLWSKRIALVLFGWFASSAYHGTLTASKAVKDVPVLQAQVGCEHYLARTATDVANQAITAANSEGALSPTTKAIPKDNCARAGRSETK